MKSELMNRRASSWPLFLWLLLLPATSPAAEVTIQALLAAASHHPNVEAVELTAREVALREKEAGASLYPKVSLFGRAELYNSPTNLRPMPPTEVNMAAGDSIPFSREIWRYGLSLETPLYIAKIYRLREKLAILAQKSTIAHQIDLISRQAAVVSLDSGYQTLVHLQAAVESRLQSLTKTREDVELKVKNGRSAEAELLKIDNSANTLHLQARDLALKTLDIRRDLQKLTGLAVTAPVAMELASLPADDEPIAVKLAEKELAAREKEVDRARAARYPTISFYGTLSDNNGNAYNTDSHISRAYNFAGLVLSVPIFDRTTSVDEELARTARMKAEKELAGTRIELTALEEDLKARLPVVEQALQLAERSRANDEKLLAIARVAYESGRTTTEEYLRYEAQVMESQAAVARARDEKWQIVARQAVLYGTDLRGIVK